MYQMVLAALDRDDPTGSSLIARRCASLANQCRCEFALVHVRLLLPESYTRHLPHHWETDEIFETQSWLRQLARDNGFDDRLSSVGAPGGSIAGEVVCLAREMAADLIVVAAHRMSVGRIIMGTNTNAIVRDAPCDVLVVREQNAGEEV